MTRSIDIEDLLIWSFRDQRVESARLADPDAVTVYWAVLALPEPHVQLISRHARQGSRPNWHAETGRTVSLARVRQARFAYVEWVRALTVLQRTLEGTLGRFRPQGPALDETPWAADRLRA